MPLDRHHTPNCLTFNIRRTVANRCVPAIREHVVSHAYRLTAERVVVVLRLEFVAAALASLVGCQTILDLEEARLDPSLTTEPRASEPGEEEPTSAPPAASDAGSSSDLASSAPAPACEGFDNSRVGILRADGTLPPLPDAPTPQ